MLENLQNNIFDYTKLSSEEQSKRGILGRLKGVIADFKNPTRNGRYYSEELWDKTFEDPIVQEKIKTKTFLGEIGHPVDRLETDMEKVAICLSEQPKKGKDGKLYGIFDILDTPNGRILKTLCDYGCSIGVSSRADGETESDFNGNESVIPESFRLECWDAVLLPAVKEARMSVVNESLGNKTLKQALNESLDKATADEKKIMTETLDKLNIDYKSEKIDNKTTLAANNAGAIIVNDLQESLLANQKLEAEITNLQEKLSVCYAKESKYEEDIAKYKTAIRNLSESASNVKALQGKLDSLTEQLTTKDTLIGEEKNHYNELNEQYNSQIKNQLELKESLSTKVKEITVKNTKIKSLEEELSHNKELFDSQMEKLNENLAEVKKNLTIKTTEYNNKIASTNKLVEKYRSTAKIAVDKYIDLQARMLGANANEIKNKLPENYSFEDIDSICENLQDFKLKVNKLPIDLSNKNNIRLSIKESKEPIIPKSRFDDSVDDSLLKLAGLDK